MISPSEEHSLTLGLGLTSSTNTTNCTPNMNNNIHTKLEPAHVMYEPCLTLSLSNDTQTHKTVEKPCSVSVASTPTFSHVVSVKRERESLSSDDDRRSSRISDADDEEDGSGPSNTTRKKLRLTKDQSALLEESFKHHSTLNPKQKQALADRLNLRPRQVEVWFQNRRARTKLKQTEVDCEYLKKWCETLTEENRRLEKELQELKAMKLGHPFYMHLPAATLTMCPSCERICNGVPISKGTTNNSTPSSKDAFALGPNKSLFYPPQQIRPLLVD